MGLLIVISECVKIFKVLRRKNTFERFGSKDRIYVEGGAQIAACTNETQRKKVSPFDWAKTITKTNPPSQLIHTHGSSMATSHNETLMKVLICRSMVATALPMRPPHWLDIQNVASTRSTWTLLTKRCELKWVILVAIHTHTHTRQLHPCGEVTSFDQPLTRTWSAL